MENTMLKEIQGQNGFHLIKSAEIGPLQSEFKILPEEDLELDHFSYNLKTPLREDAFTRTDEEKVKAISHHFRHILDILGLDLRDESLKDTPERVAKMYVREIFSGLNPGTKPQMKLFPNTYQYNQMLVEKDITLYSYCEHHLVPIIGRAHVAYIPESHVVGLSKLNRIVQYYARRPQVQERLTMQIGHELMHALKTEHVAVVIEADHLCVASRGVKDVNSHTVTSFYHGKLTENSVKQEFIAYTEK